jgi:hypothetical protein
MESHKKPTQSAPRLEQVIIQLRIEGWVVTAFNQPITQVVPGHTCVAFRADHSGAFSDNYGCSLWLLLSNLLEEYSSILIYLGQRLSLERRPIP